MRLKRHLLPAALLAVAAIAIVLVPDVLAQNFSLDKAVSGTGIPKTTEVTSIIARILRIALSFVGTLFLLLMVYGGFTWMTARGDAKKIDSAKQAITGAIIGVLIVASAYAITAFVLTAATGSGDTTTESSTADVPAEQCSTRSCNTPSDCVVPGSGCYTGTCLCDGGTPRGAGDPCPAGESSSCGLVNP